MSHQTSKVGVTAVRAIFNEWRRVDPKKKLSKTPAGEYLLDQCRRFEASQAQLCKKPRELEHLAQTYAAYLSHSREVDELTDKYQKGEISIADAANRVGLRLPKLPTDS